MKFISSLLKKFKKSSPKCDPFKCTKNIWNHEEPTRSTQEKFQKPANLDQNSHKTLRRQNRFVGMQKNLLILQNRRCASEVGSYNEKKTRRARKQKRFAEHYRRIQMQPKIQI